MGSIAEYVQGVGPSRSVRMGGRDSLQLFRPATQKKLCITTLIAIDILSSSMSIFFFIGRSEKLCISISLILTHILPGGSRGPL